MTSISSGSNWSNKVSPRITRRVRPNPASIALHEKFGMRQVAHFREVGNKFGQWLDVGYWQALLKD